MELYSNQNILIAIATKLVETILRKRVTILKSSYIHVYFLRLHLTGIHNTLHTLLYCINKEIKKNMNPKEKEKTAVKMLLHFLC